MGGGWKGSRSGVFWPWKNHQVMHAKFSNPTTPFSLSTVFHAFPFLFLFLWLPASEVCLACLHNPRVFHNFRDSRQNVIRSSCADPPLGSFWLIN